MKLFLFCYAIFCTVTLILSYLVHRYEIFPETRVRQEVTLLNLVEMIFYSVFPALNIILFLSTACWALDILISLAKKVVVIPGTMPRD